MLSNNSHSCLKAPPFILELKKRSTVHARILKDLQHEHDFASTHRKGERRTKLVLVLTFLTMVLEITAGFLFGSMALLADGWHMGTPVAAFIITLFAYRYARKAVCRNRIC